MILEAGPRFDANDHLERMERELRPSFDRRDVWDMGGKRDQFTNAGSVPYALNRARVKGVGGTTLHWQGMVPRLHPEDFEMESRYGVGSDWPISYSSLEPYYGAAEREIGVAGAPNEYSGERSEEYPLPAHPPSYLDELCRDAFEDVGMRLHSNPVAIASESYEGRTSCVGYGTCNPVCPSGAKYSADVHARRSEQAGATIRHDAPVMRLLPNENGTHVDAVEYRYNGELNTLQASIYVLAAGGIETPRLLLQSACDAAPNGLANSSGAVGRYFMEHPSIKLEGRRGQPSRHDLIGFDTGLSEAFYGHTDGPTGSMLFIVDNDTSPSPVEAALTSSSHLVDLLGGDTPSVFGDTVSGDAILRQVAEAYGDRVGIGVLVEQLPNEENHISLDPDTTDTYGNPVPHLNIGIDETTEATLERAQSVLHDLFDALEIRDTREIGSPRQPSFSNQHLGTVRMGQDPQSSVVDEHLQTHDVDNLFLSTSGVFPTGGAAPPTLTIAALTLRLADHLLEELGTRAVNTRLVTPVE